MSTEIEDFNPGSFEELVAGLLSVAQDAAQTHWNDSMEAITGFVKMLAEGVAQSQALRIAGEISEEELDESMRVAGLAWRHHMRRVRRLPYRIADRVISRVYDAARHAVENKTGLALLPLL